MVPDKFEAIIFPEAGRAEVRTFDVPQWGPTDMVVRVTRTGISAGTEYLVLTGRFPRQEFPCAPGYQSVGTVVALGDEVEGCGIGDRVFGGIFDRPEGIHGGCGATHFSYGVVKDARPIRVPDNVPDEQAVFAPLIGVSLLGTLLTRVDPGHRVAVVGLGIVGQMSVQLCKQRGAIVLASDLDARRAELAGQCGADQAFALDVEAFNEELRKRWPNGADIVIETSGNTKVLERSIQLLRFRGRLCVQGHYPGDLVIRFLEPHGRQISMHFPCGWGGDENIRTAFHLLSTGQIQVAPLISHRFPYTAAPEVYQQVLERSPDHLGVVFAWD